MSHVLSMEGGWQPICLGKAAILFITGEKCPYMMSEMTHNTAKPPTAEPALIAVIKAHVAASDRRVSKLTHHGELIWVKQLEKLSLRMWLQKGNPKTAFTAERNALLRLQTAGVPVPVIVAQGPGYFATADSGPSLKQLFQGADGPPADHLDAYQAAGKQLALMHKRKLSHGRPSIKDICWKDRRITFLDFERFHEKRNTPKGHMQDLVMMIFSAYAVMQRDGPEIDALIKGYRDHDPADIWQAAARWCAKMHWLDILTKPIQWRGPGLAREFKAIPLTFQAFERSDL
ncbi:hypothetical protein JI58_00525 [Marinosulfonomonas sp. PRT-SC04]|nr:hypothetical protein JI58_00525 [Marinosulfonomonas sp. PRT-SC04]